MHPAKEIHMVKRHLSLLVVAVACIALLGGCASKYGALNSYRPKKISSPKSLIFMLPPQAVL